VPSRTRSLSGWGRTAATAATICQATTVTEVAAAIRGAGPRGVLARGLASSYGDAAQNAGGTVIDMTLLNHIGAVDPATGWITCDAGVTIDALLRSVVPCGWFIPVTPGTRMVTLGGAVAADVHGKNHHRDGSFINHVNALTLLDGSGELRELTPDDALFWAVAGGMGLTGVVVSISLQLTAISSAWMNVTTTRTEDLSATMQVLESIGAEATYSVAWVDCLSGGRHFGRGVVTAAEHTAVDALPEARKADPLPFDPRVRMSAPGWIPTGILNARSVAVFNEAYFRAARRSPRSHQQHAAAFFHPLDAVRDWNRLYGRPGFVQYQFLTRDAADVEWAIEALRHAGAASFLAVLKRFGSGNRAPLSFPRPGWALAVDIPTTVDGLSGLLDRIDDRIAQSGGRVYLAKDSRVRRECFDIMYPDADSWREQRAITDPTGIFSSDLSRRLSL
jgi:decaprenylphospho-beta-D-ribofuranose 2-oxidase